MSSPQVNERRPFMICVPWGEQIVPSAARSCVFCNCMVALDLQNVAKVTEVNAQTACLNCCSKFLDLVPGHEMASMIDGEIQPLPKDLIDNFRELYRKVD